MLMAKVRAWTCTGLGLVLGFHNRTILFRAGDWIFVTYGPVAGAAFFTGFSTGLWYDAMTGQDITSKARFYVFWLLPAVLIGSRAFSVLPEWRMLLRKPLETLVKPVYGLHGGMCGGLTALILWDVLTDGSLPLLLDPAAFAMPLGEAICRLGCYVYGCCWGKPTGSRVGVAYENPHAKVVRCAPELRGVKIHPVQLYSVVAHLIQFAVFYALLPYKFFDGMFAVLYSITHPAIRFTMEHFRQDDRGRLFGPFTHSHLYSSIQFVSGIIGLAYCLRSTMNTPLNTDVRWIDAIADPATLSCLALLTLVVILSFGVHYRSVGSWLPRPRRELKDQVVTVQGV
jgi:prolipoprotein diacylglyceryltransferase